MTTDQIRDELAARAGWDAYDASNGIRVWRRGSFFPKEGERYYEQSMDHPMPPTLDGANAAVPEGWTWNRWGCLYRGYHDGTVVKVPDHGRGHEMDDLYQLALACVRAEEAKR